MAGVLMLSMRCRRQLVAAFCLFVMLLLLLLLLFAFAGRLTSSPLIQPGAVASYICGENEERACIPCAEPTCSEPYLDEISSCMIYKTQCMLGCTCKFGYLRDDKTFKCVPAVGCQYIKRFRFKPILNP